MIKLGYGKYCVFSVYLTVYVKSILVKYVGMMWEMN